MASKWEVIEVLKEYKIGKTTKLVITVVRVNGKVKLDVRTHVKTENYEGPTKGGFLLERDMADTIQHDDVFMDAVIAMDNAEEGKTPKKKKKTKRNPKKS